MSCSSSSPPHEHSPNRPPTTSRRKSRYDIVKLLKAIAAFRLRSGVMPTRSKCLPDFLNEVKEIVPQGLNAKQLYHLEAKFRNSPVPAPNCSEFDRYMYELGAKAWGPRRWISKGGSLKRSRRAGGKGYVNLLEEDEVEDEDGSPYKYLKHALEDFWIGKNLNLNVLQLALQKVDSVEAKRLDEQFMEIAKDELRLKMEKNRMFNDILHSVCSGL